MRRALTKETDYFRRSLDEGRQARAEAEALRADAEKHLSGCPSPMFSPDRGALKARLSPPAPAPCKHSWVEEENEADQLQTACELCGAIKPAPPAKDGGP